MPRFATLVAALTLVVTACTSGGGAKQSSSAPGSQSTTAASLAPTESSTATPRQTPAPGKGNLQGSVFYKDAPAPGIQVDLCEKFAQFLGTCSGTVVKTTTDSDGGFVVPDVAPATYEGLLVHVFTTNRFIYPKQTAALSATYTVAAGQTVFVPRIDLWKPDLAAVSPSARASVPATGLALRWKPYPDAAYYKVTLIGVGGTGYPGTGAVRVEGTLTTYAVPAPPGSGSYQWWVEAYTAKDTKFAACDPVTFTVKGAAASPSPTAS